MLTPECYQPALADHLLLLTDEASVDALLQEQPHSLDAVVVFTQAAAAAARATAGTRGEPEASGPASCTHSRRLAPSTGTTSSSSSTSRSRRWSGSAGGSVSKQLVGCGAPGPPDGDGLLLDYVIRMNSSDVPPTQLLQDLFDVSPGVMPLPGNLLW